MIHGFRVIVKCNDGTEDMIYEYNSEKRAQGIVRRYEKANFVESVKVEEF